MKKSGFGWVWVAMVALSVGNSAWAQEYYGGTIVDKRHPDLTIGAVCASEDVEGACEEFQLVAEGWDHKTHPLVIIRRANAEEVAAVYKGYRHEINGGYLAAGFGATGVLLVVAYVEHSPALVLPAILIGGAIDLAKSPLVLAAWAGHRLFLPLTKRKIGKLFQFAMDPSQRGEEKRISSGLFEAMSSLKTEEGT